LPFNSAQGKPILLVVYQRKKFGMKNPTSTGTPTKKVGRLKIVFFEFVNFMEINKNKILFLKIISIFALCTTKSFKSSLNDK
jgi:hypothetical protein